MFPVWVKYHKIDSVLQRIEKMEYGENKCLDFSNKLVESLREIGLQSEIVIGESPSTAKQEKVKHAWVGVWIEPQTGEFTKNYYK
jgi:predicted ATP-grasp superfamily ATP-dependent carboligase